MTEFYSEPEQAGEEFREIIAAEGGMMQALAGFDEQRGIFCDRLAEMAAQASGGGSDRIEILNIAGFTSAAEQLFKTVVEESASTDDAKNLLMQIILDDDNERITMIRQILEGDECFDAFDSGRLEEMVDEAIEGAEVASQVAAKLAELYRECIGYDAKMFVGHLGGENEDDTENMSVDSKPGLRQHAVDVAKIAAGVAIGLAVNRLLRRQAD